MILGLVSISVCFLYIKEVIIPIQAIESELRKLIFIESKSHDKKEFFVAQLINLIKDHVDDSNNNEIYDTAGHLGHLSNQIKPHFLYNTLESIRGKAMLENANDVAEMIEVLESFFRYTIEKGSNVVLLEDELQNVDTYLKIQQFRFDNKFQVNKVYNCSEAIFSCRIPKLTLQPLVENAIVHGLYEKEGNCLLTLRITESNSNVIIHIEDNGVGIDPEKLQQLNQYLNIPGMQNEHAGDESRIALRNVIKRLKLLFDNHSRITFYSTVGLGTDVEVSIPKTFSEDI